MPNYNPYGYNPYNGYMVPNYNQNMVSPNYGAAPMQAPNNYQMNRPMQNPPMGLNGKVIQLPDEITPNDVLMDGSISYFPAHDGSCIYAKSWNQNGSIDTIRYIPETVDVKPKEDPYAQIFQQINERLSKIEKALTE